MMELLQQLDLLFVLAGLGVGLMVGFTGVGGGALMTPLLVLGFGIPAQVAVGTDLLYAAITKTAGSATHGLRNLLTDLQAKADSFQRALLTIVGQRNHRAARQCRRFDGAGDPARDGDHRRFMPFGAGCDLKPPNGTERRQCFAAKPERADFEQISAINF